MRFAAMRAHLTSTPTSTSYAFINVVYVFLRLCVCVSVCLCVSATQLRARPLKLMVGKPIATDKLSYHDRDTLSDQVKQQIASMKHVIIPHLPAP